MRKKYILPILCFILGLAILYEIPYAYKIWSLRVGQVRATDFGRYFGVYLKEFLVFPIMPSSVLIGLGVYFLFNPPKNRQRSKKLPEENLGGADEIKKYKELLDSGIITQSEYDMKKREILEK